MSPICPDDQRFEFGSRYSGVGRKISFPLNHRLRGVIAIVLAPLKSVRGCKTNTSCVAEDSCEKARSGTRLWFAMRVVVLAE